MKQNQVDYQVKMNLLLVKQMMILTSIEFLSIESIDFDINICKKKCYLCLKNNFELYNISFEG